MSHTKFEPENPPHFEGFASVTIQEPGGAPVAIVNTTDAFQVKVSWEIHGNHANTNIPSMTNAEWKVSSYLETVGPGPDMQLGTTQTVPFPGGMANGPKQRDYEATISLAPGDVAAGTYRLVTVIVADDPVAGTKPPYAAFVDGPTLQLFDSP